MAFDDDPTEAIEIALKGSMSRVEEGPTSSGVNGSYDTDKHFFSTDDVMVFSTQNTRTRTSLEESSNNDYLEPDTNDDDDDKIDFLQDEPGQRTLGRRLAKYLSSTANIISVWACAASRLGLGTPPPPVQRHKRR
jgi:hypothetical protein